MKTLLIAFVFTLPIIAQASGSCIDMRKTFFAPCNGGETRMKVQGVCEMPYEAESTYCAVEGRPECIDVRKAFFAPCKDGMKRIFVQGQCSKLYEAEHTYCASR